MCCHDSIMLVKEEMLHVRMVRSISQSETQILFHSWYVTLLLQKWLTIVTIFVINQKCNNFITKMVGCCNHFCNKTRTILISLFSHSYLNMFYKGFKWSKEMCWHDLVNEMLHLQIARSIFKEASIVQDANLFHSWNVTILLQKWLTVVTIFVIKREM